MVSAQDYVVELRGVSKAYERAGVEPIDLELRRGEIVYLLGLPGCRRTMTLRMIAGFVEKGHSSKWYLSQSSAAPFAAELWEGSLAPTQNAMASSVSQGLHVPVTQWVYAGDASAVPRDTLAEASLPENVPFQRPQ